MLKRKIQVTIVSLLFCVGWAFAGTIQEPEKPIQNIDQALAAVPLPKLSAREALDIANKFRHSRTPSDGSAIVATDWCKSSDFQPRLSDGSDWSVLDDKDAYAWFVTYLEPPQGYSRIRSISIIRIKDDGKAD